MKLLVQPRAHGRWSLSIVESYRRTSDGKPTTRTVIRLGYLDELEKEYEDPVAHFTEVAAEMTAKKQEETQPIDIKIYPAQKIDMRSVNRKNVGCAPLLAIYNKLGVEGVLRNLSARTRVAFDLNAIMRLLVIERILAPGSKLQAHANKDAYFFRSDFTEDDLYRSLDLFASVKDRIISAMNKQIEASFGRDTKNVFYDVTNYYFEAEPDEFRKKGVSKEKRPNPIVQMGLLQDSDAVPITYRLFPGNTSDSSTMLSVLSDMKRDLLLPTVTAVADKGLNCSANMAALVAKGDGFIFSQSLRGTKSDRALKKRVLEDEGYQINPEGTFKIKSWQGYKTVHLKAEDTGSGKPEDIELEVKYVAFWSKKYEARARKEREKLILRASELVVSSGKYASATHYGAAKYVRGINVDTHTGEIVDCEQVRALDEEAIAKDALLDGYYLIVTSRLDWQDQEIVDAYRGLWQIEESFRVTKSDIEARPVYVRTPKHIEAHFLSCYIALVVLRLLQKICPERLSAHTIIRELSRVSCSSETANWWLFDYRSELTELLFEVTQIKHPLKHMRTQEIKKLLKKQN